MAIIVTGTPGTGKTTFAKELAAQKGYEYRDINYFIKKYKLSAVKDKTRDARVVDEKKFSQAVQKELQKNKNIIIDSHFSHDIPAKYIEACYVMKTDIKTLKQRLEARKYSEAKIRENLDAEIFDTCRQEAKEAGHNVITILT